MQKGVERAAKASELAELAGKRVVAAAQTRLEAA
ncbi:hypothetical protein Pcac1_g18597 [Phytophthora cactorum]|nr:hypothetical protein Pcac1_g18597 [Phytophthora cactorum]